MVKHLLLVSAFSLLTLAPAFAADMDHMNHAAMETSKSIYAKDMDDMHKAMMVEPTGDADIDFVRGMIPHHEGAVAMAKTVIAHGQDPEIRKLAQGIVEAQEKEIAFMKEWLKKHPVKH